MEIPSGAAPLTSVSTDGGLRAAPASSPWLISAPFDLLFVANLAWPGLLVLAWWSAESLPRVEFWQIYFLTTPHRWLTLLLVAADPDRRGGRTWLFVALAILALAAVAGTWAFTGAFLCLAVVDYLWNSWHFGAQHAGILRMYSRRAGGGRPRLETFTLRLLVVYTSVRLAGWTTGWIESSPSAFPYLQWADWGVVFLPAWLLVLELRDGPSRRPGKVLYLLSVVALYGGLLAALASGQRMWILPLTLASATFHAVEYMAIVTFYAVRRREQGSAGAFQHMARHWILVLGAYVLVLGLLSTMLDRRLFELWLGINLWAAFLHYAYDGMIWKLRQPQTAQVLAVEVPGATKR